MRQLHASTIPLRITAIFILVLAAGTARAQAPDPIEGMWWGQAGFPTDRVDIGFEFKRKANNEIRAHVYQPLMNFYGLDLGEVKKQGDSYVSEDIRMNVTLRDGKLEGTYFPLNAPITLQRTDKLPGELPIPDLPMSPAPKWEARLGAAIYAPATVRDGMVYIGTSGGMFHAINLADGKFAWSFAAGRPIHGQALATDSAIFFVCDSGYLFKLNRKDGKEIWRYDLGDARAPRVLPHQVIDNSGDFDFDTTAPQPLLENGILYVGSGDGSLHAVNAEDAKRIWRFQGEGKIRTDATLDATRVYVGTIGNFFYGVDKKSGSEVWKRDTKGPHTSSPLLVGDKLIVGNRNGLVAALNPVTGETIWRMLLWGSAVESTPTPAGGGLFVMGSSDLRRTSMVDSKDARVLWRTDVYGWAWPRPAISGKTVYQSTIGFTPYQIRHVGGVLALDLDTGKVQWRFPAPELPGTLMTGFAAPPIVDGKTLIVGGLNGTLYAFPIG